MIKNEPLQEKPRSCMDDRDIAKRFKQLEKDAQRESKIKQKKAETIKVRSKSKYLLPKLLLSMVVFLLVFPPFYWPLTGRISSQYMFRFKPDSALPALEFHNGIDIAVKEGTNIYPTSVGVVRFAGYDPGLGYYVVVDHFLGFSSVYGHLSKLSVRRHAIALPGLTKLGESGTTGRSTGPHLHFAIKLFRLALPPQVLMLFHSIRKMVIRF